MELSVLYVNWAVEILIIIKLSLHYLTLYKLYFTWSKQCVVYSNCKSNHTLFIWILQVFAQIEQSRRRRGGWSWLWWRTTTLWTHSSRSWFLRESRYKCEYLSIPLPLHITHALSFILRALGKRVKVWNTTTYAKSIPGHTAWGSSSEITVLWPA